MQYRERRTKLANIIGEGLILISGNDEAAMNYRDNVYPFRQDSTFLYLCGISQPGLALIIDASTGKTTLFGEEMTTDDMVWTGPQPSLNELADKAHIDDVKPYSSIREFLHNQQKEVCFLPPYRGDNVLKIASWLGVRSADVMNGASEKLIRAVVSLREIKDEDEIKEMENAVNVTAEMHIEAMKYAKEGMTEADVMAKIQSIALAKGTGTSYPPIVTRNGEILHNHHYHSTLKKGDLLLIDAGAQNNMFYAGDITRTFPIAKDFTQQQKEIYSIVLNANKECIIGSKDGVSNLSLHLRAARIIVEGLSALGIMKGDPDEAVAAGAHALFMPHGLGHQIGLDVHDMEDLGENLVGYDDQIVRSTQFGLKSLRLGKKLKEGMVITVEPGIYFIPGLIDIWKNDQMCSEFINYEKLSKYRDFGGIRIEDNILIQKDGHRILGKPIPKEIADVEKLR
ncbi:aminopeptidase P family protein [Marinigracilibium pacificum]|uniref:Xaa-Pro aminopeptidase n=1 Tax=Marinigracilibium pacificum TaxID=2729599 RepID=A0A848IZZ8_9BACT|nr:aminopeptidase P family protein [Marinigracilibium pacificum]NMM49867.1 aminopeptidase P family protein [Marinigracilibium pacificum]